MVQQGDNMIDYRKFYCDILQVEISKNAVVHHIDHDRNNNDIENLVAIPEHIHQIFHGHANLSKQIISQLTFQPDMQNADLDKLHKSLKECVEVLEIISICILLKKLILSDKGIIEGPKGITMDYMLTYSGFRDDLKNLKDFIYISGV